MKRYDVFTLGKIVHFCNKSHSVSQVSRSVGQSVSGSVRSVGQSVSQVSQSDGKSTNISQSVL